MKRPSEGCQLEGIIIATGNGPIPANVRDETLLTMELWLRDERRDEFCYNFRARMDRRRDAKTRASTCVGVSCGAKSMGLFGRLNQTLKSTVLLGRKRDQQGLAISDVDSAVARICGIAVAWK